MSINAFRNLIEKPSCVIVSSVVLGLAMTVTLFSGQCARTNQQEANPDQTQVVVATIQGSPLTEDMVNTAYQNFAAYNQNNDPLVTANFEAYAISQSVDAALMSVLAKQRNITISDEELLKKIGDALDMQVLQVKQSLIQQGKLKPDATEADFEAEIKKTEGKTLAEIKQQQMDQIKKDMQDPVKRAKFVESFLPQLLQESFKRDLNPTEDEVKASYDKYTVKRILVGNPGENATEQAQKIIEEIKGGLSFEAAMRKYSKETPQPKKTVDENTQVFTQYNLQNDPNLKPISSLKPGEISQPINGMDGTSIYKLISKKSELPKDYEKNKAALRESYILQQAPSAMGEALKKLRDTTPIEWKKPGYKVLYQYSKDLGQNPPPSEAEKKKLMQGLVEDSKKAYESNTGMDDQKMAALAWFAAQSQIWNATPAKDQSALLDDRIAAVNAVIQAGLDTAEMRYNLVELYEKAKDKRAGEQLKEVAERNLDYDTAGQSEFNKVNGKLEQLKKEGLVTPEVEQAILKVQADWTKAKKDAEELKKQQEKMEADIQAQAKKDAEASKSNSASNSSNSTSNSNTTPSNGG